MIYKKDIKDIDRGKYRLPKELLDKMKIEVAEMNK